MKCNCGQCNGNCIKKPTITGAGVVGCASEEWLKCGAVQRQFEDSKKLRQELIKND